MGQPSIPTGTSEPTRNGMPTTPVFSGSFKDPEGDGDFFTDLGDLSRHSGSVPQPQARRQSGSEPQALRHSVSVPQPQARRQSGSEDPFAKPKRQQSLPGDDHEVVYVGKN